jgi:hypothetical protein
MVDGVLRDAAIGRRRQNRAFPNTPAGAVQYAEAAGKGQLEFQDGNSEDRREL